MVTPNVIIAGASKCGTTSVFEWLSDHPDVCVSTEKEPGYFTDKGNPNFHEDANYHQHGLEKYQIYFEHCKHKNAKVILEATTEYIYSKTALEALSLLKPCPKILFVLRKPSERIYSVYKFLKNNMGVLDKGITFHEFAMYTNGSNTRIKGHIQDRSPIERSKYVKYISKWIERYGEENVKVFLFEHLKENPIKFMKDVSKFISIEDTFWDHYSFLVKNESYRVKNRVIHGVSKRFAKFIPEVLKESLLKRVYLRFNTDELQQKRTEDSKTLAALDREFLSYNTELSNMLKIDLSAWD